MSVRLHEKYGLNPTISQCIICGREKNEIALLGAGYKGEAPMHMVISIEPCDECKKKYLSIGVLLVEATNEYRPLRGRASKLIPVPTGSCKVIKDEAFKRMFNIEIPKKKICLVESDVFELLKEG